MSEYVGLLPVVPGNVRKKTVVIRAHMVKGARFSYARHGKVERRGVIDRVVTADGKRLQRFVLVGDVLTVLVYSIERSREVVVLNDDQLVILPIHRIDLLLAVAFRDEHRQS